MKSVERLAVYHRAYAVSVQIHKLSLQFPRYEQYGGLASQIRQSSKSVVANLVEGYTFKKLRPARFINHLEVSIGSCDETRLWLRYSVDVGYISDALYEELESAYDEIGKMLWGLYQRLISEV